VADPSYTSLQNNDRNTAFAIVLRPLGEGQDVQALSLPMQRATSLQTLVAADAGATATLDATTYLGPNELVRYQQEGYVDLPGLFRPNLLGRLSLGILWVLRTIHDYVGNWGLSIIVLTLLFRALVWPLINTQTKSMFGMQELQPKIQALQKKYKDDRETLTQETMKLYREAGVNPAGGCLPILLQMPLFIILWRVFVNFEFGEGFLWVPDLGQSDPFFILPILYIAVMFGMSWFSARGNPQSLRQQILINVVFAFILFGFPAGVLLYFVVSMGIQVLQYWLISRGQKKPSTAGA
jgi:YidC/Oxa1 family membrane protein insertase